MSRLTKWLDHRMEVVGIERLKDLAEYSGVSLQTLRDVYAYGSLDMLSRSERRWLAAALRVCVRRLEQLNDGATDWIEDGYVYDAGKSGRPVQKRDEDDPNCWAPLSAEPQSDGTPLIGRIRSTGKAEPDEDWQEEWGRRIPRRFGTGRGVYALELEGSEQSIVFCSIPAWELREGEAAVYCWNGWEAEGWYGRVSLQPSRARVVTPDGQRHDLDVLTVVRIGKLIAWWPASPDASCAAEAKQNDAPTRLGALPECQ